MTGASLQFVNDDFINACRDYFYLVNLHYPERGVLKLVGDRYRLSGDQRTVLYRGISSQKRADNRRNLLTREFTGKKLLIDGYNILFSLINYRLGKILFISTDGILRDAGSLHGKLKEQHALNSGIEMMVDYLALQNPASVEIYLDSPVSHSEKHAALIREMLTDKGIKGKSSVIRSADWALRHGAECIIATSDTGIIDSAMLPVTDLPLAILRSNYNTEFLDLAELLSAQQAQHAVDKR